MKGNTQSSNNYIQKLFLKSLLLVLFVFIGSVSYAINPFEEINAVSQDPYSAHSIYLGMSEKEYQEKFHNEFWDKIKDSYNNGSREILYKRNLDYGVLETLSIVIIKEKVGFYEFSFLHYPKYTKLITDMAQVSLDNISKVLGKAPNSTSEKNHTINTLIWQIGKEQELKFIANTSNIISPESPFVMIQIQRQGNPAYL